ncbi:MAG: VCBS repeat-containing protein [Cellulomonas sp.]|nr:hypothetical protein [Cellulomonas sp.]MCR6648561.1 VCBS repeat-containing protein [Cellulomonas sp.]
MRSSGRAAAVRLSVASAKLAALALTLAPGPAAAASAPEVERRRIGPSVLLATSEARPHAAPTKHASATVSDFDGDGVDDLAVAARGPEWVDAEAHSVDGAVAVRYSSLQRSDVFVGQDEATRGHWCREFASALATGDFDHDGYDDLAVGSTCESPDGSFAKKHSGAVFVFPGSRTGLDLSTVRRLSRSTVGVPGRALPGERFGQVLAAGDLNGDGYDDLAVGMPEAKVGSARRAGAVVVLFGARAGLSGAGSQAFDRSTAGVPGAARADDQLGTSLSIGRVTADGYGDLVVGAPDGRETSLAWDSAVLLVPGGPRGLAVGSSTMAGGVQVNQALGVDRFAPFVGSLGASVVVADVDGDGRDEVVAGAPDSWVHVPGSRVGAARKLSGAVVVLEVRGSTFSLDDTSWVDLGSAGVPGHPEQPDAFGTSLTATDLDRDGRVDVAVGAPRRRVGSQESAGAVYVLKGTSHGLTGLGSVALTQATAGVPGYAGAGDGFGRAIAFLDVDGSGRRDLVVGAASDHALGDRPGERSGGVTVFRNVSGSLRPVSAWGGARAGVTGQITRLVSFGSVVAGRS